MRQKKKHWTQTAEGKARLSRALKDSWARRGAMMSQQVEMSKVLKKKVVAMDELKKGFKELHDIHNLLELYSGLSLPGQAFIRATILGR